ncbi:MAG: SipW-dependent-type signal peptide-containing protein, partial [Clostridia bacterium]|nr:SipW-dependent-type signal peptide-containing protein [Clostridia bacterium]
MTKKHSTKKALIASVLSLVLCFSMLIGTTFAWFTDSVTSANNIIKSGNLDVELYYQAEGQTDWTKVTNTTNVFKENALWEPGHTEVVKLKIVNEGTLALKYQLGVNVASEVGSVNVNDVEFKLSEYIKFGI